MLVHSLMKRFSSSRLFSDLSLILGATSEGPSCSMNNVWRSFRGVPRVGAFVDVVTFILCNRCFKGSAHSRQYSLQLFVHYVPLLNYYAHVYSISVHQLLPLPSALCCKHGDAHCLLPLGFCPWSHPAPTHPTAN